MISEYRWWHVLRDISLWYWIYAGASVGLMVAYAILGDVSAMFAWMACFGLSVSAGLANKRAKEAEDWADMVSMLHEAPRYDDNAGKVA